MAIPATMNKEPKNSCNVMCSPTTNGQRAIFHNIVHPLNGANIDYDIKVGNYTGDAK